MAAELIEVEVLLAELVDETIPPRLGKQPLVRARGRGGDSSVINPLPTILVAVYAKVAQISRSYYRILPHGRSHFISSEEGVGL